MATSDPDPAEMAALCAAVRTSLASHASTHPMLLFVETLECTDIIAMAWTTDVFMHFLPTPAYTCAPPLCTDVHDCGVVCTF